MNAIASDLPGPIDASPGMAAFGAAGLLAAAGSVSAYAWSGAGLGTLLGACVSAAIVAPGLSATRSWRSAAGAVAGAAIGSAAGLLIASLAGQMPIGLAWQGMLVAASLAVACGGMAAGLNALRLPAALATWMVTLAALLWLAWPIWLSPYLAGREDWVARLSAAHPLLALDAAFTHAGGFTWTQHKWMYAKLTILGQHVLPRPPSGVTLAVALHICLGVAGLVVVRITREMKAKKPA